MRVLKLWVVIDDKKIFDLAEEKPLMIEPGNQPVKIIAQNGYHSSKPLYVNINPKEPLYIEVGCTADNARLWIAVISSALFFALFFVTGFSIVLLIANIPFLFLIYLFFIRHEEFITVSVLKMD